MYAQFKARFRLPNIFYFPRLLIADIFPFPPYFTTGNNSTDDYEDSDDEDVHNRFSHYKHLHYETTHHIRCPGYIEDFKVDLKALLTTKVTCMYFVVFCTILLQCRIKFFLVKT